MNRNFLLFLMLFLFLGCSQQQEMKPYQGKPFAYYPAGLLSPSHSGTGRVGDNYVYAPGIRFPLEHAPAYLNSQVYGIGGLHGAKGSLCDQRNYAYPWRDNYCEKRSWNMPLCSGGKGHQGVDIRPATCEKKRHYAVAVERGIITYIGCRLYKSPSPRDQRGSRMPSSA